MTCMREGELPMPPKPRNFRRGASTRELFAEDSEDELDEAELARIAQLLEELDEQALRDLFEEYLRLKGGGDGEG